VRAVQKGSAINVAQKNLLEISLSLSDAP